MKVLEKIKPEIDTKNKMYRNILQKKNKYNFSFLNMAVATSFVFILVISLGFNNKNITNLNNNNNLMITSNVGDTKIGKRINDEVKIGTVTKDGVVYDVYENKLDNTIIFKNDNECLVYKKVEENK